MDGREAVVQPMLTATSDRDAQLVLARANAIFNKLYVVSVNAAAPAGLGRSLIVDPEGIVRLGSSGRAPAEPPAPAGLSSGAEGANLDIGGTAYRTIWVDGDGWTVLAIDQRALPHSFRVLRLSSAADAATAIREMAVRGAPLIGAAGAYGLALAARDDPSDAALERAHRLLAGARPTGANLVWALDRVMDAVLPLPPARRVEAAYAEAARICDEDVAINRAIGEHGAALIERRWAEGGGERAVEVLTHCNAGWLATVDRGTALAGVYEAVERGVAVHVWVDETRPRNQGAGLTAWELAQMGIPYTVVVDSAGGHLMQRGLVDLVLVGTDRTTAGGDVCNKIGTYLKALAARANGVPFYVAAPSPSIDWGIADGVADVPIEERDPAEVTEVAGVAASGRVESVRLVPDGAAAANWAFDVTPAELVTGLITERGVAEASAAGLARLFPDRVG
jgi:methylthioribose-1-phosphate isomerase